MSARTRPSLSLGQVRHMPLIAARCQLKSMIEGALAHASHQ